MAHEKVLCSICKWHGMVADLLTGLSPFDGGEIYGCPTCLSIDSTVPACAAEDCWQEATAGTPTPDGYKHTCHEHIPREAA
jgi:hypothetical protein